MQTLTTISQVRQWRAEHSLSHCSAVYTMGALHRGHVALMEQAREWADRNSIGTVVASIFVNPTQFGNAADLAAYPRTLDADMEMCAQAGVDAVFVPDVYEMYPQPTQVVVQPGPLGDVLEGESRPGHFAGVLTVVSKLLNITSPTSAHFGEKDYQQLSAVRTMVRDLNINTEIVDAPTVRDHDGLALSSRNVRLTPAGRAQATSIPRALLAVQLAIQGGATVQQALDAAHALLHHDGIFNVDYLVVTGPDLGPIPEHGSARVLLAVTIDGVRLIDNREVVI